ncbi:hypothetical protein [Paeniglutamicibacter kerguelensis]|uniref:DUF8175 domain-containing protein n=1 Tax=Paeniglutamicibacter kerguelensis TaxID=254788 RepID=A0ABS4XIU3_9MICC|nr:hypothetical protein [Paeniglutamicibacter kerguelensis]MBP2388377.1 hypothetical protein [Paeniglutamicibacter kerguelensis]
MAEEQDPLGKSWKRWGGILALILAVVVLGIVLIPKPTPTLENTPMVQATDPAQAAPSTSAGSSAPSTGDCPALSTDASFPNDPPATEWKRHPAGMLLPVSKEHGAAKQDGDFWRCFSHTPTGAVFAGATLSFEFSSAGVLEAAAESPQREAIFNAQKNASGSGEYPAITGYRVMNSSKEKASVEYLAPYGEQSFALRINVLWDKKSSDWRLDLSSGEPTTDVVTDTSAFTRWK